MFAYGMQAVCEYVILKTVSIGISETNEKKISPCVIRIFPGEKTPDGPEFSVIVVIGKYPLGKYLLLSRAAVKIISHVPRAYILCRRRTLVISRSQTIYKRKCPSRCVLLIYVRKFSVREDERQYVAHHLFYWLIKCLLLLLSSSVALGKTTFQVPSVPKKTRVYATAGRSVCLKNIGPIRPKDH